MNADDKTIDDLKDKINKSVKIKVKEASIKLPVGIRFAALTKDGVIDL
ncbi:hypothetical protein ES702_05434 [subsurface metagenome]